MGCEMLMGKVPGEEDAEWLPGEAVAAVAPSEGAVLAVRQSGKYLP